MDNEKIYTCVCGREFYSSQSFNAHQGRCKIKYELNGDLDGWAKIREVDKAKGKKSGATQRASSETYKAEKLFKWIEEKHTCERCGVVMTEKFGSGRFCSVGCANSRKHSDATRDKIRNTVKSHFEYVEYKGKTVTRCKRNKLSNTKIRKKHNAEIIDAKHKKLYEELDMANSPYGEYNRVWASKSNGRDVYTFGLVDDDGNKIKRTVVPVYRYIIEHEIGRKLDKNEVVHHIDHNKNNNDISNLVVMSRSEHTKLHATL